MSNFCNFDLFEILQSDTVCFVIFVVINQVFPNIGRFLRYVLKNEQLSQEAESLRIRYDTLLGKLERMAKPIRDMMLQPRPVSFTVDDSKLLHFQSKFHDEFLLINLTREDYYQRIYCCFVFKKMM